MFFFFYKTIMATILTSGVCSIAAAIATREYCTENIRKMVMYVQENPNCTWDDFSQIFTDNDKDMFEKLKNLRKTTSDTPAAQTNNNAKKERQPQQPQQVDKKTMFSYEITNINTFGTNNTIPQLQNLTYENIKTKWASIDLFEKFLTDTMVPLLLKPHLYSTGPKSTVVLKTTPLYDADQMISFLNSLCNRITILN